MAYENGSVNSRREAWVPLHLSKGLVIDCLVDTGFNGALVLPRAVINQLQAVPLGKFTFRTVGNTFMTAEVVALEIDWLGEERLIEVIISDSDDALIGTALLDGARLEIDYIHDVVTIS